jgi:hypothetical protein
MESTFMNRISTVLSGGLAFLAVAVTQPAGAASAPLPPALAEALKGAELDTPDAWAFRQTLKVDAMGDPAVTAVTRWDPSRPAGQQCTVVSVTVAGDKKDRSDMADDDPCEESHDREVYGDLVQLLEGATIETLSETPERAEYRIEPRSKEHGFKMGGLHINIDDDDAERLVGTVSVARSGPGAPYVERVAFKLKEPSGNLVAKLGRMGIVYTYGPDAATGAKLLRGLDVSIGLNLFTFLNVTTDVSLRFDEYRRVR